jgi:hypothetical protein
MKCSLVLPIAGTASRLLGLPKFLLPISDGHTLLTKHIQGAIDSGITSIKIICRDTQFPIVSSHLSNFSEIEYSILKHPTATMNETLSIGCQNLDLHEESIISLSDSFFFGVDYRFVYQSMATAKKFTLGCFDIRPDQLGKLGQVKLSETSGEVVDLIDKDPKCPFTLAWGLIKIDSQYFFNLDKSLPHIGNSLKGSLAGGMSISAIRFEGQYFDCGTFDEYKRLLNTI